MTTMSRDMAMGEWEGNVAALRAARVITAEIQMGQQPREGLEQRIRDAIEWVAGIGFRQVYDPAPSQAICDVVNETIVMLQHGEKTESGRLVVSLETLRVRLFPQAPVDIDGWYLVTDLIVSHRDRLADARTWLGYRSAHFARSSGSLIVVVNAFEQGLDDGDGETKWYSMCDDHGEIVGHSTLKLAKWHASEPEGWCQGCWKKTQA